MDKYKDFLNTFSDAINIHIKGQCNCIDTIDCLFNLRKMTEEICDKYEKEQQIDTFAS